MAMSRIANANPRSYRYNVIQDPLETGKKICIVNVVGAPIHHKNIGHLDCFQQHNLLVRKDGIMRCAIKEVGTGAAKIRIIAISNQAVDIFRTVEKGIPDGNGGIMFV